MEEQLANEIHVSKFAVHSWRCRTYSPNDIDLIEGIANYFDVSKDIFLRKKGGEKNGKIVRT